MRQSTSGTYDLAGVRYVPGALEGLNVEVFQSVIPLQKKLECLRRSVILWNGVVPEGSIPKIQPSRIVTGLPTSFLSDHSGFLLSEKMSMSVSEASLDLCRTAGSNIHPRTGVTEVLDV